MNIDDVLNTGMSITEMPIVYYGAMGVAVAFFLMTILWVAGRSRKVTFLHGLVFGAVAAGAAVIAQHFTALMDWIYIGMMGYDYGATLFVIGMAAMITVMIYNFLMSDGDTLVE